MSRALAAVWLAVVLLLGLHLADRLRHGLMLRTDLMALLPRDEADPALQRVNDAVTQALSRRIAILVGHRSAEQARAAASTVAEALGHSALVDVRPASGGMDRLAVLGALYFPHRAGLLSEDDRRHLLDGHGDILATRALSMLFGPAGMADAQLLKRDPFMLLPAFFASLPVPASRLGLDRGMLSVADNGVTWVLVSARLRGDPYSLDVQRRVQEAFDSAQRAARAVDPEVQVLHAGAVFFAGAGAQTTMADMSMLGAVSSLGTIALVLLVFRALTPLLLSLLAIGVGMGAGLSVSLLLFDNLHIMAMLLGLSLIGIAVDYSLYYCVEIFAPGTRTPGERLMRVMPGITLGLVTTVVGYATFLLAPFPGLRQVAAFSAVGLIASFATVVLWLPLLDRRRPARHGRGLLKATALIWEFWQAPKLRPARLVAVVALVGVAAAGSLRITPLDDVRRMQSLASDLVAEQAHMQRIAGYALGTQFFAVRGADAETALQREEALMDRLHDLRQSGAVGSYRAPASFVPSARRQSENRQLRRDRLDTPLLADYLAQIGLSQIEPAAVPDGALTLAQAGPLAELLQDLMLPDPDGAVHIVMLDDIRDIAAVAGAAQGIPGVRFVDPAADFSRLLGRYRQRATVLIAMSALPMLLLLAARYRWRRALRVMLPAVATVVLVPLIKALCGSPFTFFDAMALVLVLSIAVDYAVFCAEADAGYRPVALLGVALAMLSTALSFGPLARSGVAAVHAVGSTMLLGVALAFVLAPSVGRRR